VIRNQMGTQAQRHESWTGSRRRHDVKPFVLYAAGLVDEMRCDEFEGVPYPPYIDGGRVTGRLDLNLVDYMIIIIRNMIWSVSDQIYLYLQDSFLKPCGVRRAVSCAACIDLVSWTTPDGSGVIPPHTQRGHSL
jgi:hypothetical protein